MTIDDENTLKSKLIDLYVVKKFSIRKVAEEVGMSPNTLRRRLISFGIGRRDKNEREDWWQTNEFLTEQYLTRKKTTMQIAEEVGSTASTVRQWLIRFGIETRQAGGQLRGKKMSASSREKMRVAKLGKFLGSDNPNWKGAEISDDVRERSSYQAKIWRKACIERDDHTCQKCGSKDRLHVHHILEYKDFPDQRWNINNGVTVCAFCHEKIHKREFPDWLTGRKRKAETQVTTADRVTRKDSMRTSKEELERLYQTMSIRQIADHLQFNVETVRRRFKKLGIQARPPGPNNELKIPTEEALRAVYPSKTLLEAGKTFGVGQTLFLKWLKHYNIERTKAHRK